MKYTNLRFITLFITFISTFYSCSSKKQTVDNLYKQRQYLLKEFKDKSIIGRSEKLYLLSYYSGQNVNSFYFEKVNGKLILTGDTLQYPVNEISAFATVNTADSLTYQETVSSELNRLLKVMDSLKIIHVSAEDRYHGIDMKIVLDGDKALLYVSDVAGIKNERWKNYVTSGKALDSNWYYVKDE